MEKIYYKKIAWSALILSFIGFLDTLYLTYEHLTGSAVNCAILTGCDKILTSQYSTIVGIPLALLGMFYYLVVLALAAHLIQSNRLENIHISAVSHSARGLIWLLPHDRAFRHIRTINKILPVVLVTQQDGRKLGGKLKGIPCFGFDSLRVIADVLSGFIYFSGQDCFDAPEEFTYGSEQHIGSPYVESFRLARSTEITKRKPCFFIQGHKQKS